MFAFHKERIRMTSMKMLAVSTELLYPTIHPEAIPDGK